MPHVRSVRFRLLLAVNTAIIVILGSFLIFDYRQEVAQRVSEKHIALAEEAKTLLPAALRLELQGTQSLQSYIDDVCGRMRDDSSPGHHIAIGHRGTVLQAMAHHRASNAILGAMQQAAASPTHRAVVGEEELVVGSAEQTGMTVYVSEYMSNIRRSARQQMLQRLPRIVLV